MSRKTEEMVESSWMDELPFTQALLPVSVLEIDPKIQRDHLSIPKVEKIKREYNPRALGVITVSKRNAVTNIVLDGMHRVRATAELFDGTRPMYCHVYEGLTRAEEVQIFLDLNAGNQPTKLDKFRVRLEGGVDSAATEIDQLTKAFGWVVQKEPGNATIQAIDVLDRIYARSVRFELQPNLLQYTLQVITKAWGTEQDASKGVLFEGIAAFLAEYGYDQRFNYDSLIERLTNYKGGPMAFLVDSRALANSKRIRVPMAVAEKLVEEYNRQKTTRALPPWRRRK
jgi:hypothetical protein